MRVGGEASNPLVKILLVGSGLNTERKKKEKRRKEKGAEYTADAEEEEEEGGGRRRKRRSSSRRDIKIKIEEDENVSIPLRGILGIYRNPIDKVKKKKEGEKMLQRPNAFSVAGSLNSRPCSRIKWHFAARVCKYREERLDSHTQHSYRGFARFIYIYVTSIIMLHQMKRVFCGETTVSPIDIGLWYSLLCRLEIEISFAASAKRMRRHQEIIPFVSIQITRDLLLPAGGIDR